MLSGLPPEMLKMAKEMGLDPPNNKKYEPINKIFRKRNKKKLNKHKMVKKSRQKNRK